MGVNEDQHGGSIIYIGRQRERKQWKFMVRMSQVTENRGQYQGLSGDSKAKEVIEVESVKSL